MEAIRESSKQECVSALSERDLYLAAQAVVDAAICCRQLKGDVDLSDNTREILIRAVKEDPFLTSDLFNHQ